VSFITPDTGAMHVACTSDVKLIALFGNTSVTRTGPYPASPNITVIEKQSMQEISPEMVYQMILSEILIR